LTLDKELIERLDKTLPRTNLRSRSELVEVLLQQILPQYEEGAVWTFAQPPTGKEMFKLYQKLERRVEMLEKEATKNKK
jgi:hypothetical protein